MKYFKVKDLKRARKQALKLKRNEKLNELKKFQEHMVRAEEAYLDGKPRYSYEVGPKEVEENMNFWQRHPIWSELVGLVTTENYTKTRIMMYVYFRV